MILLALCIFFTLVNVLLVSNYLEAARERDQLAYQVGALERAVQRLQARNINPGTAQVPLAPGENPFPRELQTAELNTLIPAAAQASGVRIDAMTPQLTAGDRLAVGTYRSYRLSVRATGTATQLADFLARVERGPVRSWVIDNTQARPVQGVWEISFDITAYAQPS